MARKLLLASIVWLMGSTVALAQTPEYNPQGGHLQTFARLIGRDTGTLTICVIGTTSTCQIPLTVSGGSGTSSSFAATFPSTGTALGVKNGANMVNLTADGSSNLNVNCAVGCSGGTASNASSAVATSSTNGTTNGWLYGFNGTTWDQLQVNGSKALKVDGSAVTQPVSNSTEATAMGTTGSTACATSASTCDMIAVLKGILGATQGTGPTTTGNLSATLAMTTATTTKIITGVSSKLTYITGVGISSSAAATVSVVSSATQGNNCTTSPTTIWQMDFPAGGGVSQGSGIGNLIAGVAALNDVCMTVSATSNVKTNLAYVQQ